MGNVNGRKFTEKNRRKTGEKEKEKKKKENKVEEFQLANLARPSQAKMVTLGNLLKHSA